MQTILLRRGDYSIGATSKLSLNSDKQPVGWTVPESERLLETGALLKSLFFTSGGRKNQISYHILETVVIHFRWAELKVKLCELKV